jgi:formylglycine-generating enzyme required for sulfatase activity
MTFDPRAPQRQAGRLTPGDLLNNSYEVLRRLGPGGMGEVYLARDITPGATRGEWVAIKVLKAHYDRDSRLEGLLYNEAHKLKRIRHDAVVRYVNMAEDPGLDVFYIAMEYIDGVGLDSLIGKIRPERDALVALIRRIAEGLAAAHAEGLWHRDLSPDNVMVPAGDLARAKIIDFGIAKDVHTDRTTMFGGGFAGKFGFAAPEQFLEFGQTVGPWTDIYSLGLVMASLALGRDLEMAGAGYVDAIARRRAGVDVSDLDPALRPLFARMLATDTAQRFASMTALIDALGSLARETATPLPAITAAREALERTGRPEEAVAAADHAAAGRTPASLAGDRDGTRIAPPPGAAIPAGPGPAGGPASSPGEPPPAPAPAIERGRVRRRQPAAVLAILGLASAGAIAAVVVVNTGEVHEPRSAGSAAASAALRPSAVISPPPAGFPPQPALPDARALAATTRAPTIAPGQRPGDFAAFRDCADCLDMVALPGGRFTMGSPKDEAGRSDGEDQVSVTLADFAISRFAVTRGQYAAFVTATGRPTAKVCFTDRARKGAWASDPQGTWRDPAFAQDDSHPVVCVNWNDATAYAAWMKTRTGQDYRLVSEAEYEFADRAGTKTAYFWGPDANTGCAHTNIADATAKRAFPGWMTATCDDGYERTSPAGHFASNRWGLFDTDGDVVSWVANCYDPSRAARPSTGRPDASARCDLRVVRGASWATSPRYARAAIRGGAAAIDRGAYIGFRLARPLSPTPL